MDFILGLIILGTAIYSYLLARKGQRKHNWSKKKSQFLFVLFNVIGLFVGLFLFESLLHSTYPHGAGLIMLEVLIYGMVMFGLSSITYRTHSGEKKNFFDDDFVPQHDIWILDKYKEILPMELIAIILALLPLAAIFITLYFL